MPLDLPIAVVLVDNAKHELARLALEDTLAQISPRQILIYTDAPEKIAILGRCHVGLEYHAFTERSVEDAARVIWYRLPKALKLDHFLSIQWDGWVLDTACWTDEFLDYDYVGAPWPIELGNVWYRLGYTRGRNVGNGGFSLVSTRLARHLATHRDRFPFCMPMDDSVCRRWRPALEAEGFRWAPEALAAQFSFECAVPPDGGTFGFHGRLVAKALRE